MNDNRRSYHVVVRTHGGLGNQIFQILYARLLANGLEPELVHDANYPHAFSLNTAFAGHPQPGSIAGLISRIRLPKLLERARLSSHGTVTIGATIFADAYFQDTHFYRAFSVNAISHEINRIRRELQIHPNVVNGDELHHIRLGDFFDDEQSQLTYLAERFKELPAGAFIITNREDLVKEAIRSPSLVGQNLSIVPSASASADETLRLMSGYRTIISNDSTLAFWAACLAGRRLVTPSPLLNALFDQLCATD
ncbi:hypothetical protein [Sphingomonas sp. CFBP 13706]|uniref:hypothetical protein n=1 Tax=Sphingomonas sp. CFBP 13706 TaxID=2775314 RepID=UPI001785BAA2|nr:hypothetical protein [Sphingomonas sp. CFBP 13706]MBD8737387.1 hypothetical protein [Sphingomonas sp. CFBP 13706]